MPQIPPNTMNRILPTIVAFLSLQIGKLKKVLVQFSQIDKGSFVLSFDKTGQNNKGLSKSFVCSFILLVFVYSNNYGQCTTYPGGTTRGTYTFNIDNPNSFKTAIVNAGQYVTLNVVKGFTYTFTVGNVFNGGNFETLTVFNAATNTYISGATNTGDSGVTLTWLSTISGQIKIVLFRGNSCTDTNTGDQLTLALTGVNDTEVADNQLFYPIDSWRGHVYNIPAANAPTTQAYNLAMFTPSGTRGYAGYYTEAENFGLQNFGGNTVNFPILSNSLNYTNIYTQGFAVRYRMTSTRPAGCYLVTIKGDDGTRLYVNGTSITNLDKWGDHATDNLWECTSEFSN